MPIIWERWDGFRTLDPSLRDLRTFSDGLNDFVEMTIVSRLPPDFDVDDLQDKMEAWRNGAILTFRGSDPAYVAEKNTPPVRALFRAIRAEGAKPRFKLKDRDIGYEHCGTRLGVSNGSLWSR